MFLSRVVPSLFSVPLRHQESALLVIHLLHQKVVAWPSPPSHACSVIVMYNTSGRATNRPESRTCRLGTSLKIPLLADIVERSGRSLSGEEGRSLNYVYMAMKQTKERVRAAAAAVEATRLKT